MFVSETTEIYMAKAKPTGELIQLHLMDEIPRIGSGRRWVVVLSLGHKWVRLHCPSRRKNIKITRRVWDRIAPKTGESKA
jgi:hypothetical protein